MRVAVTGATGYIGRPLVAELLRRGHSVLAVVRRGSEGRLPPGATAVVADPLRAESFAPAVEGCQALVHLVGTPKPAPWKSKEFRAVDGPSALASIDAACRAGVRHYVYLSVAHPAPIMRDYIAVRAECEARLRDSGTPATVLRPWYVLGPGHWWPYLLVPAYKLGEAFAATRDGATRLGLVTHAQMVAALVWAVENPAERWRVIDVPEIRRLANE
jgi:uncharacterized protein YbjT (DUF2867 family)